MISVSYDPTGRELMTTSSDGKLRLWDLRSRKLIGAPLPGSDVGGWGTLFPDGGHAIAVFPDGTGIVWNTNPRDWKAHACRVAHRTSPKRSGATSCPSAPTAQPAREPRDAYIPIEWYPLST